MNTLHEPQDAGMLALIAYWQTDANNDRVVELEGEGLTNSDAQGVADAEFLTNWKAEQ